jgi:hypothetical protein
MSLALSPFRALIQGIADVVKAPFMLMAIALLTMAVALPFAAILQSELQESLSVQPHVSRAETEIDPEWWMDFREHARGLAATFTPAVLGFAATLDGLSGVLDGKRPPVAILLPLLISVVAWAFIWGGALQRFHQRRAIGVSAFMRAGVSHLVSFIAIAAGAAIVNAILYLTVHRLLFGPVHAALVAMTSTERDAFLVRVVLYAIFFSLVALVSLAADYARVSAVAGRGHSPVAGSLAFIRRRTSGVVTLYVMTGAIFVIVTAAYGTLEIYGGSQVGGWRAIAIGQAYVLVRLAIRLTFAASELRLFSTNQTAAAE